MKTTILDLMTAGTWAILPERLAAMVQIARRENLDIEGARAEQERVRALSAKQGMPLDGTRTARVRDGIATIPVHGPIFPRANMMTDVSGATSAELVAADIEAALNSPEVSSIILDVSSPGGEVEGVEELAAYIGGATKRKPIYAYVGGVGASAAYWVASAASAIVVSRAAAVGSIGVVASLLRGGDDDTVEIVSSQSPNKRPDLETDAGRAQIQQVVDQTADVFVADVAKFRGVSVKTVLSDFGGGGLLVGKAAVKAGMADLVGTYEGLVGRIKRGTPPMRTPSAMAALGEWTERGFSLDAALYVLCPDCNQGPTATLSGEYPCATCGLPTLHDEAGRASDTFTVSGEHSPDPAAVAALAKADTTAREDHTMSDDLAQAQKDLATAQTQAAKNDGALTALQARFRISEVVADLSARLGREPEQAEVEADVLKLASVGLKALNAASTRYMAEMAKLPNCPPGVDRVAANLVGSRAYGDLTTLAEQAWDAVQVAIPANPSANVREGTKPHSATEPELTANQEALLAAEAKRKGVKPEALRAQFLAVQADRQSRVIGGVPA